MVIGVVAKLRTAEGVTGAGVEAGDDARGEAAVHVGKSILGAGQRRAGVEVLDRDGVG